MKARPSSEECHARARARAEFAAERARAARLSIPELIALLESEDLRTRFVAEMRLRDATDT
ncbi:MAG TPA: hypothetical protein VF668_14425 [Pyrinomonadaceae bacterium]|jgi:hypothetical protein